MTAVYEAKLPFPSIYVFLLAWVSPSAMINPCIPRYGETCAGFQPEFARKASSASLKTSTLRGRQQSVMSSPDANLQRERSPPGQVPG
jgi:hypothetical protein